MRRPKFYEDIRIFVASFGIGPILTYSTKLGKIHLDFNAPWIRDFDVSKAVEGDCFNFTASLKL